MTANDVGYYFPDDNLFSMLLLQWLAYLLIIRRCVEATERGRRRHLDGENQRGRSVTVTAYWRCCWITSWLTTKPPGELVCDWSTLLLLPLPVTEDERLTEMFQSSWRWNSRSILNTSCVTTTTIALVHTVYVSSWAVSYKLSINQCLFIAFNLLH